MELEIFKKNLLNLKKSVDTIILKQIDIKKESVKDFADFKERKKTYYVNNLNSSINALKESSKELMKLGLGNSANQKMALDISMMISRVDGSDLKEVQKIIDRTASLLAEIEIHADGTKKTLKAPKNLPPEIKGAVIADLKEIENCFKAECYRSAAILCGRVLETALYRKYFEITGIDLLETSPGIGLGKLIAKLLEKNIKFEPGLTQQIHLVNQMRIFSVHVKQDAFYPSKNQAEAMILYTLDALEKMFAK